MNRVTKQVSLVLVSSSLILVGCQKKAQQQPGQAGAAEICSRCGKRPCECPPGSRVGHGYMVPIPIGGSGASATSGVANTPGSSNVGGSSRGGFGSTGPSAVS